MRALLGFTAATISVLIFHQGTSALLNASGVPTVGPYSMSPVPPFGVPMLVNRFFWGGLYGLVLGLILPWLPRAPLWLLGFCFGLLSVLVGWFVVAPLKGLPIAGGFVPARMWPTIVINGVWGIGIGLVLSLLLRIADRTSRHGQAAT
ncbi:hypothetical protein [Paracraurococcus lichenis]|uniref:Uncharacterized protein n=1 Tax=Paracraurococcus lichenis TaxID=3064888 RepID=A0ABT9EAW4_9PROT|nr:hypothetical protein [Paracraurococcus sp. LOR1-02]MDO9713351.1 hypothetical protein [Paracraurococcus sp. LOR1-02]